MQSDIHPRYVESTVACACGNTYKTMSTKADIKVEICSACHPFFTGRQKIVDTEGRVEKFLSRYNMRADSARVGSADDSEASGESGE